MPKGIGDIPELRLETLDGLISRMVEPPSMYLTGLFPSKRYPSASIEWESVVGTRGLAPFKAPGSATQVTAPHGYSEAKASAAFWGEKMFFDEMFLNNLRKKGTYEEYEDAASTLATNLQMVVDRVRRRKEWMFSKMIFDGGFSYKNQKGYMCTVDYARPSDMTATLAAAKKWTTGASKDIIGDIITAKRKISDETGAGVSRAIVNSVTLEAMAKDTQLLTLLSKSQYGSGDLFSGNKNAIVGVNPTVLGSILNLPQIVVHDELYEVRAFLTAAVTADSTVAISVDDTADFEAGGTLRFYKANSEDYEDETISSVSVTAGTVTVATAPSTSYRAGVDYVGMKKKYVPDYYFTLMTDTVAGEPVARYMEVPYGLNRTYGIYTDRKENWDPDGVWIRVQDKGLPVVYHRDAIYNLIVA